MKRFSVGIKLALLLTFPLVLALGFGGLHLTNQIIEYRQIRSMEENAGFLLLVSDYINALQRERGTSALFISGGTDEATLADRRRLSDEAEQKLNASSSGEAAILSGFKKIHSEGQAKRKALQGLIDSQGITPLEARTEYTRLIRQYLGIAPKLAAGNEITSIILLEEAKEASGLLRATLSTLLTGNTSADASTVENILSLSARVDVNLNSPALDLDKESAAMLEKVKTHPGIASMHSAINSVMAKADTGNYGISGADLFSQMTVYIDDFSLVIQNMGVTLVDNLQVKLRSDFRRLILLCIFSVILLAAIMITAFILLRIILRVLNGTATALAEIAEGDGDLTRRIQVHSDDELGDLATHFNNFTDSLVSMVRDVGAATDILSGTGDELNAAMEQTAASAVEIAMHTKRAQDLSSAQNEGAQKSTRNVRDIALRADEVRGLVEREAASVIESSASIEEMLANIRAVTKNIEHMSKEYRNLIGSSDTGREKLDALVLEVKGISERSKKLEEANKLISGIAAKTNLLAMNAAIEAAHAGSAGAGFAVVADEIRQLAESVAKQSKVIASDVKEISVSIIAVSGTASGAHSAFKGMAQEIQNLSNLAEEIRNAMLEQNEGSSQILEALGEIQNVSIETRTAANAMDEASDMVLAEMDRLTASSADIDRSMTEISQGISEVSSAVNQVTSLALRNRDGIKTVREKMARFKV